MTVDDDVIAFLSRTKPYLSATILSQFFKPSLIMLSPNIAHKDKFLINLDLPFPKYLKAIIWRCLPMDRRALEKLIPCLAVIGKPWYQKILTLKDKIHFFKIYHQIRTSLDSFPEPSISYLIRLKLMSKINLNSEYTVLFCKSTTKKFMIFFKIFLSLKPLISISQKWMEYLSKD